MKDQHGTPASIFDMIETQIWQFVDPETYGTVNHAHASFLGVSKKNLEHRKLVEVLPVETVEALSADNSEIFAKGICTHAEKRIINHKGQNRCIAIAKTPRLDKDEDVEYVVCTGTDITEYKKLEEDLHHSNVTLRLFLSASPIGIGIIENKRISWVNDEMLKLLGCQSTDEVVGKSAREFYANTNDYKNLSSEIHKKLMSGCAVEKDLVLKRKDGTEFIGHVRMSSYDSQNPAEKTILTISDVTWRKEAEQQRIQSEKLKGVIEMAGAVCHELNQPLQAITGFSELLMLDITKDSPLYKQLKSILGQIKKMGDLTRRLHKITKYETKVYLKGKIIDLEKSTA